MKFINNILTRFIYLITQLLFTVIIPPLIILEPSEYTISFREGEAFELPCAATGIPEPTSVLARLD